LSGVGERIAGGGGIDVRASHAGLLEGIESCLRLAHDPATARGSAPDVSAWSVAGHLEHVMLADRIIIGWISKTVSEPGPEARADSPNDIGALILAEGTIPRGRGPAPEPTLPAGIPIGEIAAGMEDVRRRTLILGQRLNDLERCQSTRPHHVLGAFTPAEWVRFLQIHHDHHESIIRDILG